MKRKIENLVHQMMMNSLLENMSKEFCDAVPTDPCDENYISQYLRTKYLDSFKDMKEGLWNILGAACNYNLDVFLPAAVKEYTYGNVVLEKEEPTTPNDNPNPNEEDAE